MEQIIRPTNVENSVVSNKGIKTSVGSTAPAFARYAIMEIGIMVSPDVLMVRNMIMALLAVSFCLLIDWSSCIAFSPIGVAALSNPNKLAEMFMKIDPRAGCPFGTSGKSLVNTGLSNFASPLTRPLSSPIFMIPIQSANVPVSPRHISNPFLDASNVESIISGNASKSPIIILMTPTRKPIAKSAIQI